MGDSEPFLDQVLYVEPLPEDFNPDAVPTNGIEYIQKVHHEAQRCQRVVVADIDTRKFTNNRTPSFVLDGMKAKADTVFKGMLPTLDWQNEQLADFSEVRRVVAREKARGDHPRHLYARLPCMENEEMWYNICVGKKGKKSYQPLMSLVLSINQPTLMALLDYHLGWLEHDFTSFEHSAPWIYSLLVCLEIPLAPETCWTLRALSRLAAKVRSNLEASDEEHLNPINLIICLVGRYFRQFDLAD